MVCKYSNKNLLFEKFQGEIIVDNLSQINLRYLNNIFQTKKQQQKPSTLITTTSCFNAMPNIIPFAHEWKIITNANNRATGERGNNNNKNVRLESPKFSPTNNKIGEQYEFCLALNFGADAAKSKKESISLCLKLKSCPAADLAVVVNYRFCILNRDGKKCNNWAKKADHHRQHKFDLLENTESDINQLDSIDQLLLVNHNLVVLCEVSEHSFKSQTWQSLIA